MPCHSVLRSSHPANEHQPLQVVVQEVFSAAEPKAAEDKVGHQATFPLPEAAAAVEMQ